MFMDKKKVRNVATGYTFTFMLVHIVMLIVFWRNGVMPMVRVNIFSIIFYVAMLFVVWKNYLVLFSVCVFSEVVMHMTLAIIYTGWESGFELTLLGMVVLVFYAEYAGRRLKLKFVRMLPLAIMGALLFLGSYIYVTYNRPEYTLTPGTQFFFNILWGTIVFSIIIHVMQEFVIITINVEKKLTALMSHDKLTGLGNRYYISEYIDHLMRINDVTKYWIAVVDIDDFKKVNDTYGHNCGDYVLKSIANILKGRSEYECCRWGGEEFVLIGKDHEHGIDMADLLNEVREEVMERTLHYNGNELNVTVTIGAGKYENGMSIDEWISSADKKLYDGKRSGKNRVVS